MMRFALLLAACSAFVRTATTGSDVPERQSARMVELFNEASTAAATASAAATPELLAYLDSSDFRRNISAHCGDIAKLPADQMLARYEEELGVVELIHNFDAICDGDHGDTCVGLEKDSLYFHNLWQLKYLGLVNQTYGTGCVGFEDNAETQLYGFPSFTGRDGCPASFAEASDRPLYVAFNALKLDVGNPHFGDVSAVFRRGYVANMTVISPVDTGLWEMSCNMSGGHGHHHAPRNCSAWAPRTVGTLEHNRHLVLANTRFWNGTLSLAQKFNRVFGSWAASAPAVVGDELFES